MSLEMCHLLFIYVEVDFKKIITKPVQIWDRWSLEYYAMCSADFTRVDGPTMQEV